MNENSQDANGVGVKDAAMPKSNNTIAVAPESNGNLRAPNSKPREPEKGPIETYVYRDFSNAEPSALSADSSQGDSRMPPQSLESQKLPSKLNKMLSDPGESIYVWLHDNSSPSLHTFALHHLLMYPFHHYIKTWFPSSHGCLTDAAGKSSIANYFPTSHFQDTLATAIMPVL